MRRVELGRAAAALLGAVGVTGLLATCAADRERLDVPRLKLTIEQTAVLRGGEIVGRVTATDGSGLQYLRVWAISDTTIMSRFPVGEGQGTLFGDDSVTYDFRLKVTCAAPEGSPVEIQARTLDNQGFDVSRFDTVTARGATCAQSSAQVSATSR